MKKKKKKANVLLLMCDQFRGDCLSICNHPDVKTPYLDSLANDGVLFEKSLFGLSKLYSCKGCFINRQKPRKHMDV